MSNDIWSAFMNSEYAQSELKKIEKRAQDRGPLYSVDPKNKTQLSQSETTKGVSSGGGSVVGNGERKTVYTTKPAQVPGGEETYADPTVEGLEDIHEAMLDVAHREPTGGPFGTQDNQSEKWDGIQAAGHAKAKYPTKKAQAPQLDSKGVEGMKDAFKMMGDGKMMMDDEHEEEEHSSYEDKSLEEILAELDKGSEDDHDDEAVDVDGEFHEDKNSNDLDAEDFEGSNSSDDMEPVDSFFDKNASKKTVAYLKELVKIANECDQKGLYEDASQIDSIIKDEVKTLVTAKKKVNKIAGIVYLQCNNKQCTGGTGGSCYKVPEYDNDAKGKCPKCKVGILNVPWKA